MVTAVLFLGMMKGKGWICWNLEVFFLTCYLKWYNCWCTKREDRSPPKKKASQTLVVIENHKTILRVDWKKFKYIWM